MSGKLSIADPNAQLWNNRNIFLSASESRDVRIVNPEEGRNNWVWVRVSNLETDPRAPILRASVDSYASAPSTRPEPNGLLYLGRAEVDVAPLESSTAIAPDPYNPDDPAGTHVCLLAAVGIGDDVPQPGTPEFNVTTNPQHVGQHNFTVVVPSFGEDEESATELLIQAPLLPSDPARAEIVVEAERVPLAAAAFWIAAAGFSQSAREAGDIPFHLDVEVAGKSRDVGTEFEQRPRVEGPQATTLVVDAPASRRIPEQDSLALFQVVQKIDGEVVGGVSVLVPTGVP